MSDPKAVAIKPVNRLKTVLSAESVQEQFRNALQENAPLFIASLIDLYSDRQLQQCEPADVVREALKAATLKLPINRNLGFAWIVPRYNSKEKRYIPQFQPGWKGIVQLAQRTGQYRYINCGPVYEGELRSISKLTGAMDIEGEAKSEEIVGYFAYIELLNGFSKPSFWPKAKVEAHALKYNQESKKAGKLAGNWLEYFDDRAMTTVLKHLISKYGIMSVEMITAIADTDERTPEARTEDEIQENANQGEVIDVEAEPVKPEENTKPEASPSQEEGPPF